MLLKEETAISNLIPEEVVDFMLEPYAEGCRYLKTASLEYIPQSYETKRIIKIKGNLSIPDCYYGKEGNGSAHFNATEFILCFNQLGYTLLAEGVRKNILPELQMNSIEEFKEAQMERIYIGKFNEIAFRKPINSKDFSGEVALERSMSMRNNVLYSMTINFSDKNGGKAEGKSLIAIILDKSKSLIA